ncbi:flavodoxin [Candidatus Bathyarchaeota archaeon]|jgi:flavodoxin|nr:flavodoxin [Candidatus Bathyarchaeota archaeon]
MKFLVVYFSRGGKTRKVAMTIAHELGCETIDLAEESPDLSRTGFLVVGSGNYGGMPGDKILDFLKVLPEMSGGKAAVFATSGGPNPKGIPAMRKILEAKGYEVVSSFDCRGQFTLLSRGHPTDDDLRDARAFANDLKKIAGG